MAEEKKAADWGLIALIALGIWYFFLRKKEEEEPPPDGPPPGAGIEIGGVTWA